MESLTKISRRNFVKLSILGAGSLWLLPNCTNSDLKWRFFSDSEASLVDKLADLIIPPDEWPGGSESGVCNYIDKQLVGPYIRFQESYKKGLSAIQASCQSLYGTNFEKLTEQAGISFLETMEAGNMKGIEWDGEFDKVFFEMFRDHTMQAYYGSSRHGGNKNNLSYKMLKLDYPLIIGQNRYNI